jgi:hypothetical protein
LRVFISYSRKDETLARRIKNRFQAKDYLVFFDPDSIPARTDYTTVIANAITEASKEGCVLVLLTEDAVKSPWVTKEIERAIINNGTVVPVMVGNVKLPPTFEFYLHNIQFLHLSENPEVEEIDNMIEMLGRYILNK